MSNITNDDSPLADDFDSLTIREGAQPHPLSVVGELVREVLVAMNGAGDEAEEIYQTALVRLRKHSVDAAIEIARLECNCPTRDYSTRFALVHVAGELEDRAALPLLRSIVLTPIPPEESDDPHDSTVAEETIIRTAAVDGVAALARRGEKNVAEILMEFLSVPSFSIRRAAVQGLLASPQGDDLRGKIAECLPKDQRFLLDLKKVDVSKAEQIDQPQRHLSESGRSDKKPGSPDLKDRAGRQDVVGSRTHLQQKIAKENIPEKADSDNDNESPTAG